MKLTSPINSGRFLIGLLASGLVFSASCQRQTSNDTVNKALSLAKEAQDEGKYTLAYYALLSGARSDPSNPEIFTALLEAGEAFVRSDNPEALDLSYELIGQAERMLAHQPPGRLRALAEKFDKTMSKISKSLPESEDSGGFEERMDARFPSHLEGARNGTAPIDIRLLHLEEARKVLYQDALDSARPESKGKGSFSWKEWVSQKAKLERVEASIVDRLREDRMEEVRVWKRKAQEQIDKIPQLDDLGKVQKLNGVAEKFRGLIDQGRSLQQGLVDFEGVDLEEEQEKITLAPTIAKLRWAYSTKVALHWVDFIEEIELVEQEGRLWWKEENDQQLRKAGELINTVLAVSDSNHAESMPGSFASSVYDTVTDFVENSRKENLQAAARMTKLVLLSDIRLDIAVPYVRQRFEQTWTNEFEKLDEEGRVVASKLRLWRDSR